MDFLIAVLTALGAIELYAWLPRAADYLIELALRRLPAHTRDRFREEWGAHLLSIPNSLVRLACAFSLVLGSNHVGRELVAGEIDDADGTIEQLERRLAGQLNQMETIVWEHQQNQGSLSNTIELGERQLLVTIEQIHENEVGMRNATARLAGSVQELMKTISYANTRSHDIIASRIRKLAAILDDARTLIHQARCNLDIVRRSFRNQLSSPANLDQQLGGIRASLGKVRARIDLEDVCITEDDAKSWAELDRIRSALRVACVKGG